MRNILFLITGTSFLYFIESIFRVPGVYSFKLFKPLIIFDVLFVSVLTLIVGIADRKSLYRQALRCKRKRRLLRVIRCAASDIETKKSGESLDKERNRN